jgi:hypothetical protein
MGVQREGEKSGRAMLALRRSQSQMLGQNSLAFHVSSLTNSDAT